MNDFSFHSEGKMLFTIKPDGTIERGPGFTTTDEMSLAFWQAIAATHASMWEAFQAQQERGDKPLN